VAALDCQTLDMDRRHRGGNFPLRPDSELGMEIGNRHAIVDGGMGTASVVSAMAAATGGDAAILRVADAYRNAVQRGMRPESPRSIRKTQWRCHRSNHRLCAVPPSSSFTGMCSVGR
jgi:hypothetical protein